ncbi:hypothetical protein GCM10009430_23520 [Aquimarina litoralis]|uniref:Uncharacterized protein n=1 Tax=Aquimarina litoralis TaxID=584605 RepID=A0ABN1IUT5_9FLAO
MEHKRTIINVLLFHFFSGLIRKAKTIYNKNKNPCAIPITLLGSGEANKYFNGMVTNKISK